LKKQITDLDLPLAHRTQANLWKSKYFEAYKELVNANKGIRRLKRASIKEDKMTTDPLRWLAVEIAKSHLGTWYRWGGDDPSGFDCSGFIIEVLKSIDILPRSGDWTAHGLATGMGWALTTSPLPGDLVFWHGSSSWEQVVHVEMMINEDLAIGASGGGSRTVNSEIAMAQNAFIKIRPVRSRSNIWGYKDPFLK
jgi:cell wall-associated NlpC family hydrolase